MSFREKSDWLSFVSLCLFAVYFADIAWSLLDTTRLPGRNYFMFFVALVAVLVVIQVVSHVVLALRSPQDAKTPLDERERLIQWRATQGAYFLLLVGAFLTIGTMHMGFSVWQFAHCILLVIWIAELVRYGSRLYYYRREA